MDIDNQTEDIRTFRETEKPTLQFIGDPVEYLGIFYTNLFLNIVTVGFYYPWSKIKSYKYFFNNTHLNGTGFQFHGTGNELFKGFLLFVAVIMVLAGLYGASVYFAVYLQTYWLIGVAIIVYILTFAFIFPFALHRRMKYLSGRTTWRGVQWGFIGDLKSLFKRYFIDLLLCVVTFGIYIFWFRANNIKYRVENLRLGNVGFKFKGEGGDLFFLNLVIGFNLAALYAIIYVPLFIFISVAKFNAPPIFFNIINYVVFIIFSPLLSIKYMLEYYFNNSKIYQDDLVVGMYVKFPISTIIQRLSKTFLLTIATFGIYAPVFAVEMYRYFLQGIIFKGELYLSEIMQSQEEFKENTGETLGDFLDIDLI